MRYAPPVTRADRGIWITILLPLCLMSPLFLRLPGTRTPIFFLQAAVIAVALAYYAVDHRTKHLTVLDQTLLLYLAWAILTYLINLPILAVSSGRHDLVSKQFVSLLTLFLSVSPYLLGRYYFDSDRKVRRFAQLSTFAFGVMVVSYAVFYCTHLTDLYMARRSIQQRIPMVIVMVAWVVGSLGFWGHRPRMLCRLLWVLGSIIALLSLTRASYVQWAVSALLFASITFFKPKARTSMLRWAVGLSIALIVALASPAVRGMSATRTLFDRISQLTTLHETVDTELSANTRVEMFHRITEKLLATPARLVVGYGQLGPGTIGDPFISEFGEYISEYNAHDEYLDELVRGGVVGVGLDITLLLMVILQPLICRSDCTELDFFKAHSVALAGVAVYALFGETLRWQMFGSYFWVYAGMQSAHLFNLDRAAARQDQLLPVLGRDRR